MQGNIGKANNSRGQASGDCQLSGRMAHDGLVGVIGLKLGGMDHIVNSDQAADVFIHRRLDAVMHEAGGARSLTVGPTVIEALTVEGRCAAGWELGGYFGGIEY